MSASVLLVAVCCCLAALQAGAMRPTQAIDGVITKPSAGKKSKKPFSSPSGIFIQVRASAHWVSLLIASTSRG